MRIIINEENLNRNKKESKTVLDKDIDQSEFESKTNNTDNSVKIKKIVFLFLIFVFLGVFIYYYGVFLRKNDINPDSDYVVVYGQGIDFERDKDYFTDEQTEIWVSRVGELIDLPNENPTIAQITDIEKLNDYEMFSEARNGDLVMFFTSSEQVVVYRPMTHEIVEVSEMIFE